MFLLIQSRLQISSENYYSCQLTHEIPIRVSIVTINPPEGFAIIEPLEGGEKTLEQYVMALERSPSIREFQITYRAPESYWTRAVHQLDFPSIYKTVLDCGSMTMLPIVIEKGLQFHDVLSPTRRHFANLLKTLQKRFTDVKIKHFMSKPVKAFDFLLTPKQLEAFELAFKLGYYCIPRQVKIEDLAIKAGIKRVAMQERLRRAELRIFSEFAKKTLRI